MQRAFLRKTIVIVWSRFFFFERDIDSANPDEDPVRCRIMFLMTSSQTVSIVRRFALTHLIDRVRAAQAQHTAMVEELDFSHTREHAAARAAAADRRAREVAEATESSRLPGIDTKLLWKPNEFHGEDEKWCELGHGLSWVRWSCSAFRG